MFEDVLYMGHDFRRVPDIELSVFHTSGDHTFRPTTICLPPGYAIKPGKKYNLPQRVDKWLKSTP